MRPYAIKTSSLSRDFKATRAVDDLSLEVAPGTVFGFLGPNGAGKTTTIRLLLGLLEPSSGHAEVLGFDTMKEGDDIRLRCGALLEHSGLYERLSAYENLDFYSRVWHIPVTERRVRIQELLSHFGLEDRQREITAQWSRGMKQKLAVARALLHRPSLVFMDEPTAGLDPVAAAALRDDLAALAAREGVTVFLTTHNLSEAEKLCQCIGVIRKGRLIAVGSPDELRHSSGRTQLEVTGSGFTELVKSQLHARPEVASVNQEDERWIITLHTPSSSAPLIKVMVDGGVQIEEVRKGKADLEQAFLTLLKEDEK